jgi:hypothetical protein
MDIKSNYFYNKKANLTQAEANLSQNEINNSYSIQQTYLDDKNFED